jgi:hypothetical protein
MNDVALCLYMSLAFVYVQICAAHLVDSRDGVPIPYYAFPGIILLQGLMVVTVGVIALVILYFLLYPFLSQVSPEVKTTPPQIGITYANTGGGL